MERFCKPWRANSTWYCWSACSSAPTTSFYNSVVMVHAGRFGALEVYRKSHIPGRRWAITKKFYFFAGRHGIQGVRHPVCEGWAWPFVGISGFRRPRGAWH